MAKKSGKTKRSDSAWRIDGIAPEAVAAATEAAAREGLTLAAWLGRLIRETAARERATRAQTRPDAGQAHRIEP